MPRLRSWGGRSCRLPECQEESACGAGRRQDRPPHGPWHVKRIPVSGVWRARHDALQPKRQRGGPPVSNLRIKSGQTQRIPHQTATICPTMKSRSMSKRELIDRLPEQDLDRLLAFVQSLKEAHADATMPTL